MAVRELMSLQSHIQDATHKSLAKPELHDAHLDGKRVTRAQLPSAAEADPPAAEPSGRATDWAAERASFCVDDEVEARFGAGKRYYRGRITKLNRNGTYAVLYDDGDKECRVESHMMRRLGGS